MPKWIGYSSIDDNKKSNKLYDIDLIKQNLLNQFMCPIGSRWRMPSWGSIIWNRLFDDLTESLIEEIEDDCTRIVQSDERLSLISTNITKENHGLIILLQIRYVPQNITFDMYVNYNENLLEN